MQKNIEDYILIWAGANVEPLIYFSILFIKDDIKQGIYVALEESFEVLFKVWIILLHLRRVILTKVVWQI